MVIALYRPIVFLGLTLVYLIRFTISQQDFEYHACENRSTYTTNSTYQRNLDDVLSSLSSIINTGTSGFYNVSVGQPPDRVTTLALCRGDIDGDTCKSCVNQAIDKIRQLCVNQKEAIMWYDKCMLRYSDSSILNIMETTPGGLTWNRLNEATDVNKFNREVLSLMGQLRDRAARGGPDRKFATGSTIGPDFMTIYGLTQCTPDISEKDCNDCLKDAMSVIVGLNGSVQVRVDKPSCNLRYDVTVFYEGSVDATPLQGPPGKKNRSTVTVLVVVLTILGFVMIVASLCICRRKRKQGILNENFESEIGTLMSLQYSLVTIREATDNFHENNKLGEGGFGSVYKSILQNGREVAVKRLSKSSKQGEVEFKNEVLLMAKLQHRNLVKLLGFSIEQKERLLIYEFMPNASLDHLLFHPTKRASFDWESRYKVLGQVARGLLYLHDDSRLKIIHRDLKASNVLLDSHMIPKIADFGMARLFTHEETQGNTTRIAGTLNYMAPEYVKNGHFSVKLDVFSFGVLILEMVTGQRNQNFRIGDNDEHLLSFAWKSWKEGTSLNMIDPALRDLGPGSLNDVMRIINIGLLCVQENLVDRPSMASVVLMLNRSSSQTLPAPKEPGFYIYKRYGSESALDEDKSWTTNDVSVTELYPR